MITMVSSRMKSRAPVSLVTTTATKESSSELDFLEACLRPWHVSEQRLDPRQGIDPAPQSLACGGHRLQIGTDAPDGIRALFERIESLGEPLHLPRELHDRDPQALAKLLG